MNVNDIVNGLLEASGRITSGERQKANLALSAAGMDGNTSFPTVGAGINTTMSALAKVGIEPADIFQTFGPSGKQTLRLSRTNTADLFSPTDLSNTMLVFSWYQRDSGNYEVTAYVS